MKEEGLVENLLPIVAMFWVYSAWTGRCSDHLSMNQSMSKSWRAYEKKPGAIYRVYSKNSP
jgi:hypothetical protein